MSETCEVCDVIAERSVLAGIIKYGADAFVDVDDLIKADFFYISSNASIYRAIQSIFAEDASAVVDIPLIQSAANKIGYDIMNTEDSKYLRAISHMDVALPNVRKAAVRVGRLAVGRILYNKLEGFQERLNSLTGQESVSQILGELEETVSNVGDELDGDSATPECMGDGAVEWVQNIIDNPRKIVGIATGFPRYDKAIGGGIRRKTTHIIAARPKTGKSSLVDTFGLHMAGKTKTRVLNVDTEMSKEEHFSRIIANLTGVPIDQIETDGLYKDRGKAKRCLEAARYLSKIPYDYISVAGMEFEDILSMIRRWIIKNTKVDENGVREDCIILYDYFKLMNASAFGKNMAEHQALGFQLTALNNFCIKYDVGCLAFAQRNRDGATEETSETIAGSDRLLWFANSIALFVKKTAEEIAECGPENGNRKLVITDARHGGGLDFGDYIHLSMEGEYCRIKELKTRNEVVMEKSTEEFLIDDNV